jgi:hypothetical protein
MGTSLAEGPLTTRWLNRYSTAGELSRNERRVLHSASMTVETRVTQVPVKPIRRCHVCGIEAWHRMIVEPRMVLVCQDRECRRFAAQLPINHCHRRLADQRLCGEPAAAFAPEEGQRLCGAHARQQFQLAS